MNSQLLILVDTKTVNSEATDYMLEAIDAAMGLAAFGVKTSILFMGNCIDFVVGENPLKIIAALEFYDLENLYIFESDLDQFFKTKPALSNAIKVLADNEFNSLLNQHQHVLRMG